MKRFLRKLAGLNQCKNITTDDNQPVQTPNVQCCPDHTKVSKNYTCIRTGRSRDLNESFSRWYPKKKLRTANALKTRRTAYV